LEIVLGSISGSLFVVFAGMYAYANRKTNPSAAKRYRERVEKRRRALKAEAFRKQMTERKKAADAWEQYRRQKNRLRVLAWAETKFKGRFGLKRAKVAGLKGDGNAGTSAGVPAKPRRADEAPKPRGRIFGGHSKVFPQRK
jgi:hypothetical protein